MSKLCKGILLTIMLFGHNYVVNQPQSLQAQIQSIHGITTTQFNWYLYSLPSVMSIIGVVVIGIFVDKYPLIVLLCGGFGIFFGTLFASLFAPYSYPYFFGLLSLGRVIQFVSSEVIYIIQGSLASTWMGKMAGLTSIFPSLGQIGNVFVTPSLAKPNNDISLALNIGLLANGISSLSCFILYFYLKRKQTNLIKQDNQSVSSNLNYVKVQKLNDLHSQYYKKSTQSHYLDQVSCPQLRSIRNSIFYYRSSHYTFKNTNNESLQKQKQMQIWNAGLVFWLLIILCAISQCIYIPYFDNITQHITVRFSIQYTKTGRYLCIPFITAMIITGIYGEYILKKFSRFNLIVFSASISLIGHGMIYLIPNSTQKQSTWISFLLIIGLCCFGIGLGSYFSVSFPAIGYTVPETIRGKAYGILCFFQAIFASIVPLLSGIIIDNGKVLNQKGQLQATGDGFKRSCLVFVFLSFIGVLVSLGILKYGNKDTFKYEDKQEQTQFNENNLQDRLYFDNETKVQQFQMKQINQISNNKK